MKRTLIYKATLTALILSVTLNVPGAAIQSSPKSVSSAKPSVIRETPPAPVFTDEERRKELSTRRARVAEKVGPTGVLALFSAEPRLYTNDVDYEFRQENNLFYLTQLNQPGATLVMIPGSSGPREILFLPRRDPARETWTGYMYSPEEAGRISGISEIWENKEFAPFIEALRERRAYRPSAKGILLSASKPTEAANASAQTSGGELSTLFDAMSKNEAKLHLLLPQNDADTREFRFEHEYASKWPVAATGMKIENAWPIFTDLRWRKSAYELKILQHAIDISIEAHQRAQAVAPRANWEYEVEAEIDYTYRRRNADNWGYPNIVGCGPNATTLHYQESQGRVRPDQLILIDSGAEYQHYTADVTRTFPAGGKFTSAQKDIYNLVLEAQEASFKASRPGSTMAEVHQASVDVIKDGLLRLGLITDRNSNQFRMWFMHGTSHTLGMNVHDVNIRGAKLESGVVYTVEPGVYIRPDALDYLPDTPENRKFLQAVRPAFEKYKGIGVRIEDDIVITSEGYRNMSVALPRTIEEIEAFMSKAQTQVRAHANPREPRRNKGFIFVGSPMEFARRGHDHAREAED